MDKSCLNNREKGFMKEKIELEYFLFEFEMKYIYFLL